jgi:hypothetical protein
VGKLSNTVEINGKRYDVRTGKLITGHHTAPVLSAVASSSFAGQVMDGFVRPASNIKNPHRTIEKSKTLMRHAVKKPQKIPHASGVKAISPIRPTDIAPANAHPQKRTAGLVHTSYVEREARAAKIRRSQLVSKFNEFKRSAKTEKVHPMPVRQAPPHAQGKHEPTHHPKAHAIIEKGLKNAQSHQQAFAGAGKKSRTPKAKRARLASIGAGSLAMLLLAGFYTYQNIPNLAMRYATTRAGINASLPGYKPAGFALNSHIQYNPGQVIVEFKSNTDERAFTITQRESAWSSDTLRQNYVASASEQVHTYQDKGQTIFLYGGSNATWVDGGVWYDIKGDSQLNSDQLIRIATSM